MEMRIVKRAQVLQPRRQPNPAMKFIRSVKGHFPRRARSHKQRSTESEAQGTMNEQSRVAEVTKIETSKINDEVVNVTRNKSSESQLEVQPRSSSVDKS